LTRAIFFNVAVRESYRNKGVATALINELITYGKKTISAF
jgi:GNAT superfamily N-acetyltransferase